jgi:hypothetical protein
VTEQKSVKFSQQTQIPNRFFCFFLLKIKKTIPGSFDRITPVKTRVLLATLTVSVPIHLIITKKIWIFIQSVEWTHLTMVIP